MIHGNTRAFLVPTLPALCALAVLVETVTARSVPPPANNEVVVLGTLTCSLGGEADAANPGAQGRGVLCHFRPGPQGAEETYVGTMQGVGRADTLFAKGAVILAVKAPASTAISPGMLQQTYSVDAAPGSAVASLVGDGNRAIALQPLAEEEGRVAAGKLQPDAVIIAVALKLKSSPA